MNIILLTNIFFFLGVAIRRFFSKNYLIALSFIFASTLIIFTIGGGPDAKTYFSKNEQIIDGLANYHSVFPGFRLIWSLSHDTLNLDFRIFYGIITTIIVILNMLLLRKCFTILTVLIFYLLLVSSYSTGLMYGEIRSFLSLLCVSGVTLFVSQHDVNDRYGKMLKWVLISIGLSVHISGWLMLACFYFFKLIDKLHRLGIFNRALFVSFIIATCTFTLTLIFSYNGNNAYFIQLINHFLLSNFEIFGTASYIIIVPALILLAAVKFNLNYEMIIAIVIIICLSNMGLVMVRLCFIALLAHITVVLTQRPSSARRFFKGMLLFSSVLSIRTILNSNNVFSSLQFNI